MGYATLTHPTFAVLTTSNMTFLAPAAPAFVPVMHRETMMMVKEPVAPVMTSAAVPGGRAAMDLLRIGRGGTQMTIAVGHFW